MSERNPNGKRDSKKTARGQARSKWIGFFRFYGRKVRDGVLAAGAVVGRMVKTHAARTRGQRIAFGVVAVGVLVGVLLGTSADPLSYIRSYSALFDREIPSGSAGPEERAQQTGGVQPIEAPAPNGAGASGVVDLSPVRVRPAPPSAAPETKRPVEGTKEQAEMEEADPASGDNSEPARRKAAAVEPPMPIPSIPAASVDEMLWPVQGSVARSFGWYRHPVFGDWRYSPRVHLEAPDSEAQVQAALAGRVRDVINENGVWRVSIEHAGGWTTVYEGLSDVFVDSFEIVDTGQAIGRAAAPGRLGDVAFTLLREGEAVDPATVISRSVVPVGTSP